MPNVFVKIGWFDMAFAPLYPLLYRFLQPNFPDCLWAGDRETPAIALTFDDGPHPSYTSALLEVLDKHQVTASFFMLGLCVQRSPHIAQQIYQQGHWLGLHGYDHRSFPGLSVEQLRQTLERTQAELMAVCPLRPDQLRDVRPPNGFFTPKTLKLLQQWHYRPVMWSVVPEDWVQPGIDRVLHRIGHQVHNGAIIVLHDGVFGGQDVAETVDRLIPLLKAQGYSFITIDQMWQASTLPSTLTTLKSHEII